MPLSSMRARRERLPVGFAWTVLGVSVVTLMTFAQPKPAFLWNRTASEPEGLYVRGREAPAVGQLVAFQAPAPAFPYADGHMGYLRHVPILKQIAAQEGDHVCTLGGVLRVNGERLAPVKARDPRGGALPQWRDCRRLRRGELFVYSDRIPNSFDSRYFGPVAAADVIGVFRPLAVRQSPPGDR